MNTPDTKSQSSDDFEYQSPDPEPPRWDDPDYVDPYKNGYCYRLIVVNVDVGPTMSGKQLKRIFQAQYMDVEYDITSV